MWAGKPANKKPNIAFVILSLRPGFRAQLPSVDLGRSRAAYCAPIDCSSTTSPPPHMQHPCTTRHMCRRNINPALWVPRHARGVTISCTDDDP